MPLDDPDVTARPTFPFVGTFQVRPLESVADEPERLGDDPELCPVCNAGDAEYVWVSDRWRVKSTERPTGLPVVLVLESRSHLDLGDLPNLLAAELGVMTVRLERAMRLLPEVGRVHVNRWGDDAAHLQVWFLARPVGRLQLRGKLLPLWDEVLPPVDAEQWVSNLASVGAWLADFGGRSMIDAPRFEWQTLTTEGPDLSSWLETGSTGDGVGFGGPTDPTHQ